jgi:hypothetical protein
MSLYENEIDYINRTCINDPKESLFDKRRRESTERFVSNILSNGDESHLWNINMLSWDAKKKKKLLNNQLFTENHHVSLIKFNLKCAVCAGVFSSGQPNGHDDRCVLQPGRCRFCSTDKYLLHHPACVSVDTRRHMADVEGDDNNCLTLFQSDALEVSILQEHLWTIIRNTRNDWEFYYHIKHEYIELKGKTRVDFATQTLFLNNESFDSLSKRHKWFANMYPSEQDLRRKCKLKHQV